jgi:hypothetical protein
MADSMPFPLGLMLYRNPSLLDEADDDAVGARPES